MSLETRLSDCKKDLEELCKQAGRNPQDVRLIAVSKTVGLPEVQEAIACGQFDFGENRTCMFTEKQTAFPEARWHFIGSLQSNKAHEVVGKSFLIHSLDRSSLLHELEKQAAKRNMKQDVLIEVNVSGEATKAGISPKELPAFVEEVLQCGHINCKGLMTMAPQGSLTVARKTFAGLRELSDAMQSRYGKHDNITFDELSMGMSNDYACAISEGATMVRIGRKIFSESFEQ